MNGSNAELRNQVNDNGGLRGASNPVLAVSQFALQERCECLQWPERHREGVVLQCTSLIDECLQWPERHGEDVVLQCTSLVELSRLAQAAVRLLNSQVLCG